MWSLLCCQAEAEAEVGNYGLSCDLTEATGVAVNACSCCICDCVVGERSYSSGYNSAFAELYPDKTHVL